MILPMVGFFSMLLLYGGIASLAVMVDDHAAGKAPAPFAAFFASLGFFVVFILGGLMAGAVSDAVGGVVALFVAPTVGTLGGGLFGYRLGLRRKRRAPTYL